MRSSDHCPCGEYLYGEIERDTGLCGRCADREYERHLERREWEHFHPELTSNDEIERSLSQAGEEVK